MLQCYWRVPIKTNHPGIASSNAFLAQRLRASSTALVRLTFGQCRLPENVIEQVEIQVKYQGYRPPKRRNRQPPRHRNPKVARRHRLQQSQRLIRRSAAKAQPAQTRNRRTGQPHFRRNPCGGGVADGAFEARV